MSLPGISIKLCDDCSKPIWDALGTVSRAKEAYQHGSAFVRWLQSVTKR